MFSLSLLPGNEGDCLWIEYGPAAKPHRVLIDCGRKGTYKHLRARLAALPENQRAFELLVISHIDRDHIEGVLSLMADPEPLVTFEDIWFNGYDHLNAATDEPMGAVQGEELSAYLKADGVPWNHAFEGGRIVCPTGAGDLPVRTLPGGLTLTLLSPTDEKLAALAPVWERECKKAGLVAGDGFELEEPGEEPFGAVDVKLLAQEPFVIDKAEANGSSIALLAEYEGKRILLGADAHPDVLLAALSKLVPVGEKLEVDAVKVAHHGSSHNTSSELLQRLSCDIWLFSTNGSYFKHPTPSAVARVIKYGGAKKLVFNYRSPENKVWDSAALKNQWGYDTLYPDDDSPGSVTLDLGPE